MGGEKARLFSIDFWRYYWVTMRPYLLFVSGITGIAGLSLSAETNPLRLALFSIIFFLSYGFGQALTDCFQTDTDSISSPCRPLVSGKVARKDIALVSVMGLVLGGAVLVWANLSIAIWAILSILGLATYTYFKRRWWGGPFYNAWIVGVLCLIGFLAGSGVAGSRDINPALLTMIATAFFGYANFVLIGYYKDVSADRATGYNTFPVVFGFGLSSLVSDLFALLATLSFAASLFFINSAKTTTVQFWPVVPFALAGLAMLVRAQFMAHRVTNETQAHKAISPIVHAFVLLLSALTVTARPGWALILLLYYLAFVLVLRVRPSKEQI